MIFFKKYYVNTTVGVDCIPFTHEVKYAVRDAGFASGLVTVLVPEGGAGVIVVEPLPAVIERLKQVWQGLVSGVPKEETTLDTRKRTVAVTPRVLGVAIGPTLSIPFQEGKLLIDPYSDVMIIDCDPVVRRREVIVQVLGRTTEEVAAKPTTGRPVPAGRARGPSRG